MRMRMAAATRELGPMILMCLVASRRLMLRRKAWTYRSMGMSGM